MDKKQIKEKIEEGWLRISVVFELVGRPREYLVDLINNYLNIINNQEGVELLKKEVDEPIKLEDQDLFSLVAEAEALIDSPQKLIWFAVNFTPSHIEILEPSKFEFSDKDLTEWINDILARLHEVNLIAKSIESKDKEKLIALNRLAKNAVVLSFTSNEEIQSIDQISKRTGIPLSDLEKVVNLLMKEGKLRRVEKGYQLLVPRP